MEDERVDGRLRAWGRGATRRGALGLLAGLAGVGRREVAAKRRRLPKQGHDLSLTSGGTTPYVLKTIAGKDLARHQKHGDLCMAPAVWTASARRGRAVPRRRRRLGAPVSVTRPGVVPSAAVVAMRKPAAPCALHPDQ